MGETIGFVVLQRAGNLYRSISPNTFVENPGTE
jgi:hypothetical protein